MPVEGNTFVEAFEDIADEEAKEAAGRWFSASQERLYSEGGDEDYQISSVAQTATPPQRDKTTGGWRFTYPHPAAEYFEWGTEPHVVEADEADVLAFEWPDAPAEVREMFEDTFPTVFFPRVEVDGVERLDFVGGTRQKAERYLEGRR